MCHQFKKVKKTEKIMRERDEKAKVADVCPDVVLSGCIPTGVCMLFNVSSVHD